jgi:hypothetical protein
VHPAQTIEHICGAVLLFCPCMRAVAATGGVITLLFIQNAFCSNHESRELLSHRQCPVNDPTCRSESDTSALLQSRVQVEIGDADNADWPSWKSVKEAGGSIIKETTKVVESVVNEGTKIGESVINHGKKTAVVLEESVTQALATTAATLLKAQTSTLKFTGQAWADARKSVDHELAEAAKEAAALADKIAPFGKCLDIKSLLMGLMFGEGDGLSSFIDKAKSDLDITLSSQPALSATVALTLGSPLSLVEEPAFSEYSTSDGMSLGEAMSHHNVATNNLDKLEWGYGPATHGPLTVQAGSKLSFNPVLKMDLAADGKIKIKVSGDFNAIVYANITGTAAHTYSIDHVFPEIPKSMTACASVFCITLMIQGVAQLEFTASLAGQASAEVRAGYQLEGEITIDTKTGDTTTTYSTGELTHSEKITYESSFSGHIGVTAGPLFTILPFPGVPVTLFPYVKAELKAFAQSSTNFIETITDVNAYDGEAETAAAAAADDDDDDHDEMAGKATSADDDVVSQANASSIQDSIGLWQTVVAVERNAGDASDNASKVSEEVTWWWQRRRRRRDRRRRDRRRRDRRRRSRRRAPPPTPAAPQITGCGKAGVNIRAGARVEAFGFPTEINLDSSMVKSWVMEALQAMPVKTATATAKMIADCTDVPGLSSAVTQFDDIVKTAAADLVAVIPDFKISFPKSELLYKTPDTVCVNVWKDTLPKGQSCSDYNVEC